MRCLICLTLLASTSLNAGAIHKWADENGNIHYGDAPPVSAKTESVRVQSAPSNPGKALPRLSSPGDSNSANSDPATTTAVNENDIPADQAKIACDQATEDLKVISRSSRIKLRAADGSTRYLTTEEIEERKLQSESDIERFCR